MVVLPPYLGQVALLDALLSGEWSSPQTKLLAEKHGIRAKTVDSFQGKEADVVVFSTVRSNCKESLGFLADPCRCNVALTRARQKLWIVGNFRTLRAHGMWRDLLDTLDRTNSVFPLPPLPPDPFPSAVSVFQSRDGRGVSGDGPNPQAGDASASPAPPAPPARSSLGPPAPPDRQSKEGSARCSVHGTLRNQRALKIDARGCFRCTADDACSAECIVHSATRKGPSLVPDGDGGFRCRDNDPCLRTCNVHWKRRAAGALEPDGSGGWRCRTGEQCRVNPPLEAIW